MKFLHAALLALVAVPAFAQTTSHFTALPASTPCRNNTQVDPPPCTGCGVCTIPGTTGINDSEGMPSIGDLGMNGYNGGAVRSITDLTLPNGPANYDLSFSRFFSSRALPGTCFGAGNTWRHSFDWVLTDDANNQLKIITPTGQIIRFLERSTDVWTTGQLKRTRLMILESGNFFNLQTVEGWTIQFERVTGTSGTYYRMNSLKDAENRTYTCSYYAANGKLKRITDPTGRWLELTWITYTGTNNIVISSVASSDGRSVSYSYANMNKLYTPKQTVLTGANYGDSTSAVYTYEFDPAATGIPPHLVKADDPRATGTAPRASWVYHSTIYGLVHKEMNPDDGSVISTRTDNGTVVTFTYPDGGTQVIQAPLTPLPIPNAYTDRTGNNTIFTYGADNKIATKTLPSGYVYTYQRDEIGRITKSTGSDGLVVDTAYDSIGRILTRTVSAPGQTTRITTFTRDANGLVTRLDHPDGSFETWTYNSLGQPLTHLKTNGFTETWTYDAKGFKTSHTDASGATTAYTYTPANSPNGIPEGLLSTQTDPRGRTTSFTYNKRGLVTRQTYSDGSFVDTVYDAYGQAIAKQTSAGEFTQRTYGNFNLVLTETDALNRTTTYAYGPGGSSCGCASTNAPTLITLPDGTKIARTYDAQDRLLTETVGYGQTDALTTSRSYDAAGRLASTTDENGIVTTYTYDTRGHMTSTTQDANGMALTTTSTYDVFGNTISHTSPGTGRTSSMTYDIMDRPVTNQDPLGTITAMTYDLGGRVTAVTEALGTALARTTTMTYDGMDRTLRTTYPDSTFTETIYHPEGSIATRTDELGNTWSMDNAIVTWQDSTGASHTSFVQTSTDPLNHTSTSYSKPIAANGGTTRSVSAAGRVTENVSDAAGQTVLTRIAPGTASATISTQAYDLLGRVITSVSDAGGLNQTSQYTYDVHGRTTTSKDPLNRTTTYTYANGVSGDAVAAATRSRVTTTLPDNRSSVSRMDALGRMIAETDPKNQTQRHTYWYETGQQLTLTDARNNTTNWTYNLREQLLTKVYPNGDDHAYTYDTLGRMATHTTPNNHVCTYTYDLRDRQSLANWNTSTPDTAKEYFANGLLKSIDNGVSKSDYAYDVRNQLTSETQTLAGRAAKIVSYAYDADGLKTVLDSPSSAAVAYEWTARGQLQTVSADGPPPLATYTYDKLGRNTALVHENGITQSKSYDVANQLLANTHLKNGSPISGHAYTLDTTGRRTAELRSGEIPVATSYGYDAANQVTAANYGSGQTDAYDYDAMGNRETASIASQGGSSKTYTANNVNQYTTITGLAAPTHDANGNQLLNGNGAFYTWDSENRLLNVGPIIPAIGDKMLVHSYDAQHRRVATTVREWDISGWHDIQCTHFIYDGWNVIEEFVSPSLSSPSSVLTKVLTWGIDLSGSMQGAGGVGGLLMVEEIAATTNTAYHFQYDGNGNVTEITDAAGDPAASYRYDAFGNTIVATGSYAATNKYRFSTKPINEEVTSAPLYYYGYRYYDAVTGRWPSRDPIEERGGVNLYGFVGNNGVNEVDVLGLTDETGKSELFPCIDFSWDMPLVMELYGSDEFSRNAHNLAELLAKIVNRRLGSVYEVLNKALEEFADQIVTTEASYQLTLIGIYKCKCCCEDKAGATTTYNGEWSSVSVLDPATIDTDWVGDGWGKSNPFPKDIGVHIKQARSDMMLANWKKCKRSCGK